MVMGTCEPSSARRRAVGRGGWRRGCTEGPPTNSKMSAEDLQHADGATLAENARSPLRVHREQRRWHRGLRQEAKPGPRVGRRPRPGDAPPFPGHRGKRAPGYFSACPRSFPPPPLSEFRGPPPPRAHRGLGGPRGAATMPWYPSPSQHRNRDPWSPSPGDSRNAAAFGGVGALLVAPRLPPTHQQLQQYKNP
ncbi:hypothetical protein NDU88_004932 [Pleurodeles waltl]|uniref:Uncharacterized protein n=1 Tax=Pleurodeles waltl TaxID=8319 RepID=A0AAV7M8H2_PLEWA|nr:hypothetical protein NDU88_004932 [Pleurodeles waltl]